MLECLNRSVMYLDSLPEHVNVDHFRSLSVVGGRGGRCLGDRWEWGGLGKSCCGEFGGLCLTFSGIHLVLDGRS